MSGEPVFLDTNILVYAHDISAGSKHITARRMIDMYWQTRQGCLSIQVLQEFYVSITQKVSRPLERGVVRELIADLSNWRLHIPNADDLLQAINLQQLHQVSFWDALILRSATALGCKKLYSEDLNYGQQYGEVRVLNPFIEEEESA